MITDKFNTRIKKHTERKNKLKKNLNLISSIRLISFISIVYLGYRYIKADYSDFFYFSTLLAIIVFIALIIYHNKVKDKFNFAEALIDINIRYLNRINGKWINFSDIGKEFQDKTHRYSSDLDIVGERSLFQRINLSNTWIGRNTLANDLLNPQYKKDEILSRQEAIQELSLKLDFAQNLEYYSSKKKKMKNPEKIISYFEDKNGFSYSKEKKSFIEILPIIVLGFSGIILSFQLQRLYILVFSLFAFQIIVWLLGIKKNGEILDEVGLFKDNLEVYVDLLKLIEKEDFKSPFLKQLKKDLFSGEGAIKSIKKLDLVSEKINLKHSGILYLLLNIFFLWDYRCVFSLEKWKDKYADDVRHWIYSIGKFESLTSLSSLLNIEENTSFPIIVDEKNIKAKSCGHPLLEVEDRVNNNIDIDDKILIITGSNMSGKTTFLRTIGINLVLLNAGCVSISEEFQSPIMNIHTSMRVTDDLKNKISTFYAELLRIKQILDYARIHKNTVFLIDEIFKGTNSKDRIFGAKNVLKNLNALGLIGAITTHDFELCALDRYPRIANYHFAEDYIEGKISFDYKIKKGRSTSTNARHLMELVGIEVVE